MAAVWPIKVTGPLTPGMKRNKRDSKVNTIFSSSSEKKPTCRFCPFLAHTLKNIVKETSVFFFLSNPPTLGNNNFMSSKYPPSEEVM